jgi:hypothetical protein
MSNRIAVRLGLVLSLAAAVVAAPACGSKKDTTKPGGGDGKGDAKDGVALRYAAQPVKLLQTGQFDSSMRARGDYNEIAAKYTLGLELAPAGDKLKVVWTFADVGALDLKGSLAPKPGAPDPKADLLRLGKGAYLVDLRGEIDEDASKALSENAALEKETESLMKQAAEAQKAGKKFDAPILAVLQSLRAMVALPVLPEQGLAVGKPVVSTEEAEVQLFEGGPKMPTDTETKYTLVKIDDSGAKKIAEVQFESVTSGAVESQMGALVLESSTEGTILFDVDGHVPVSIDLTANQSFSAASEQVFENTMMMKATFEGA